MSHSEPPAGRKQGRLWIYAPSIALIALALAWSGGWLWLKGEVERRMDAARTRLAAQGSELAWGGRTVTGFPFRLDLTLADPVWRGPSGWALTAARLDAEAFVFAPTHWVVVAPSGLVVTRPDGGAIIVAAKVLRASLSEADAHPPRFSLEGANLAFRTPAGGKPFFLTAAREAHVHLRAGPADQGAAFLELDGAQARTGGVLARIAQAKGFDLACDLTYSHAGALSGPDWATAVRSWTAAGGRLSVRRMRILAGETQLDASGGDLSVDADGRLAGSLPTSIGQPARVLAAMRAAGAISPETAATAAQVLAASGAAAAPARITIDFQAGQTTLGPVALGPSPRAY